MRRSHSTQLILQLVVAIGVALPAAAQDVLLHPERLTEQAPDVYRARFECDNGVFVIQVTREWSPAGADRFYNLVKNGFYDDARFFRVVPDFVVQFGLNSKPAVNEAWHTARLRDDRVRQANSVGTVTFATAGPNTRTTQVFINLADNNQLDMQGFSPFGTVVEGMDVVRTINAEYGQRADQALIREQGNAYLKEQFPKMGHIKKATIAGAEKATRQGE